MNSNLFIINGPWIVFSPFIKKANGIEIKLSFESMIDSVNQRIVIPLTTSGTLCLPDTEADPIVSKNNEAFPLERGPLAIIVHKSTIAEHSINSKDIPTITYFPVSSNGFYCRSNNIEIEMAATAASYIYKSATKIYTEAYKACGENIPQFCICNLDLLDELLREISNCIKNNEAVSKLNDKEKTIAEKEKFFKSLDDLITYLEISIVK